MELNVLAVKKNPELILLNAFILSKRLNEPLTIFLDLQLVQYCDRQDRNFIERSILQKIHYNKLFIEIRKHLRVVRIPSEGLDKFKVGINYCQMNCIFGSNANIDYISAYTVDHNLQLIK